MAFYTQIPSNIQKNFFFAAPAAYGSSWARDQTHAVVVACTTPVATPNS